MTLVLGWLVSWMGSIMFQEVYDIEMKVSFFYIYTAIWCIYSLYAGFKLSRQEPEESPFLLAFATIVMISFPMLFSWVVDQMVFPVTNYYETYMLLTSGMSLREALIAKKGKEK